MLIPRLPLCIFNAHQPTRSRVSWDDDHYTHASDCRYCGKSILRKSARHWVKAGEAQEGQRA